MGVTESYDLKPRLAIGEVSLDDNGVSPDDEGYLDPGEQGRVTITVLNGGGADAVDTLVTLTSPTAGITFPRGNSVRIRRIGPFESARVVIKIALDRAATNPVMPALEVSVVNDDACEPTTTLAQP